VTHRGCSAFDGTDALAVRVAALHAPNPARELPPDRARSRGSGRVHPPVMASTSAHFDPK